MHEDADEFATPRPARFVRPPPPALARDCALFLDIDGTLAELALTPDAVRVDETIAHALPRLARELDGALALVTGRSITSADLLFPGLKLAMGASTDASAATPPVPFTCTRRARERTRSCASCSARSPSGIPSC
jgi:hypothetical protein